MTAQSGEATLGRPPKPAHLKRGSRVVILMTDDEAAAMDRFIAENGYSDRNDFVRELVLERIGYDREAARKDEGPT